jgi:pimeloyl-ACP methyl ester carboxylesterase
MSVAPRTFVLVPGAWHGAWCWSRLAPVLRERGHDVLTPELAGTADSATDAGAISLDSWARDLVALVRGRPAPVVAVAHSRGGVVISRAAELAPDCFARLVYVAAYLLPAGAHVAAAARADAGSLIPANMIAAREGLTCRLRDEVIDDAFYGDCDAATRAWARAQLREEPLKPLVTPLRITLARFGSVPRAYVECIRDRTVSLAAQRQMQAGLPCDAVLTLDCGHSPFLTHPHELAQWLDGS